MLEKIKRIDWSIIFILLLFMVVSTMLVYSANLDNFKVSYMKNIYNFIFGLFCFFVVTFINFRIFVKLALYIYGFGILLLIYVLVKGVERFGSKGWIELAFGLDFQPAELMKIILIIAITSFIARREGAKLELVRDVIPVCILGLVPFCLVFSQNDLGNASIYLIILLGMFWIGNIKFKYVLIGTIGIAITMTSFYYYYMNNHDKIETYLKAHDKEHWMSRIDPFLDPANASDKDKYQVDNSKRAIGSGSLTGDGYLKGDSIHKNFVPVAYTDAIFVVVGEEFGFVGASALLLLYFLLIYRMILISIQTLDLSGSYIIVGIVSMFVFQIFENIGMLISLMPVTGITLPFVSYGGTSLMINMISMGIVMSVKVHQEKVSMFQE
ncbi:rod shape-determining protein RodA [Paenibacillus psychroresistens]|uniref:Rod shape-determining protein RodA n=1 Tax=Paenibacillus psychroresistens TaxID=1778678 RepID=A0A6B8RJ31_9BACL|nr:FtsW/RodA/SpoVE family cell cycle protein [Paenibacillus psychroresistens]QGQ95396.1 rod shape-determining protein RodA [Paenibacillus psychroresistens]